MGKKVFQNLFFCLFENKNCLLSSFFCKTSNVGFERKTSLKAKVYKRLTLLPLFYLLKKNKTGGKKPTISIILIVRPAIPLTMNQLRNAQIKSFRKHILFEELYLNL